MLNIYDHYYEKISTENLNQTELLEILDIISNTYAFGNNKHTGFELCHLMSKSKNVDDNFIITLIKFILNKNLDNNNLTHQILDNGSKQLFDTFWVHGVDGIGNGRPLKFWRSKHSSSKQLEEIFKQQLTDKQNKGFDTLWLLNQRDEFFKHPNVPQKILLRVSKIKKHNISLVAMASNPNLINKGQIFNDICEKSIINDSNSRLYDNIFEALVNNKSLDWATVAKGINIETLLKRVLIDAPILSKKKKKLILEFCKHENCPDEIKNTLYKHTNDESYLSQITKDIFLF